MWEADNAQMSLLSGWVFGSWKADSLHGNLQCSEIQSSGTKGHPAGAAAVCAQAQVRLGAESASLGHLLNNF